MGISRAALIALMLLAVSGSAPAGVIVDKVPDLGPYWHPLGQWADGMTFVYADSFVFSGGPENVLGTVGIYLRREPEDNPGSVLGTPFRFELWGDAGNAPDPNSVLGVTDYMQVSNTTLALITGTLQTPVTLTPGTRYWIAGSTVGQPWVGSYQVGGHTQNSIYQDDGTFWYSNDPAGQVFGGQAMTPEMAIYGAGTAIPEPGTWFLLAFGLAGLALLRREAST